MTTLTDDECAAIRNSVNTTSVVFSSSRLDMQNALIRAAYAAGLAAIPREPTAYVLEHDLALLRADGHCGIHARPYKHFMGGRESQWFPLFDAAQGGKP